jgi:hypothetical protein
MTSTGIDNITCIVMLNSFRSIHQQPQPSSAFMRYLSSPNIPHVEWKWLVLLIDWKDLGGFLQSGNIVSTQREVDNAIRTSERGTVFDEDILDIIS